LPPQDWPPGDGFRSPAYKKQFLWPILHLRNAVLSSRAFVDIRRTGRQFMRGPMDIGIFVPVKIN